jgi:hypothetical protein
MSPLPFLGVSSLMNCRAFGRGFFLVWTLERGQVRSRQGPEEALQVGL